MRETLGLLGRKVGMTRIFTDEGESVPVTVLDVSNNGLRKSALPKPTDTRYGIQVALWPRRSSAVSKPQGAILRKAVLK